MGFKFVPIGPQVDYYGPVTPHMVDLDDLVARLERENKFLAAWFNDERIPLWILVKTMVGNLLTALSIVTIMAFALHAGHTKIALLEIPFLIMPLVMIWLDYPTWNLAGNKE